MDPTRRLHLSLPILILAHFAAAATKRWADTLPSYVEPDNWRFFRVAVDLDDDVFVAGTNILLRLSPDLEVKEQVATGSVMDNPRCMHPSVPCTRKKESTKNYIMVLHMVHHLEERPLVLLCGTVFRRLCQIRPVGKLSEYHWVHPFNVSRGSSDYVRSIYIDHGYDDQHTLFTAYTMNRQNKNNFFTPYLTSKVLRKEGDRYYLRYSFQNDTAKSGMQFHKWADRIIEGGLMVHDGYIYLVISYKPDLDGVTNYETRLVRVCIQDGLFQSYSELPIACSHPSGQLKTTFIAAHLDDSPSSDTKSLYVTFTRYYGELSDTALCIFPMTDVTRAFTTYPRECLTAVGHTCEKEMEKDITDFCGSDISPYTVSQPLVVSPFKIFPNILATTLTTVKNNNVIVAIVGAFSGHVIKISLTTGQIISKNQIFTSPRPSDQKTFKKAIKRPVVFDRAHQHIYFIKDTKIVKFPVASCSVHETCESCFTEGKNDPLNCGWCGGYCAQSEECEDPDSFSRDTCTPSISEVSPQKGPIQGEVKIKITGDNLGDYAIGGYYAVKVAGIPCKILEWQYTEISCILGPALEETSGPVELNVISNSSSFGYKVAGSATSHHNFSYYLGPRIFGIHPNKGPTSGGTIVFLVGENMNFENSKERYIIVHERLCDLQGYTNTTAWCVTGNETKPDYPDKIAIVVGDTMYVMDEKPPPPTFNSTDIFQSFAYIPDPEIYDIQPGITTVSGLMNVTVTGLYLDSVQSPQIVVTVYLNPVTNCEFQEDCWSDPESKGTILRCGTPSLVDEPWLPVPYPLVTHLSFIMDGVQWVRDFSEHQEFMSRLLYYPDPEFKTFGEIEKITDDQESIEIRGSNFGQLQSVSNFHIVLGEKEFCKITNVSTELIACDLPPNLKNPTFIGTTIPVRVIMGSTSRHLGYITIVPVKQNNVVLETILLVIYVMIPLIVIVVAFLCFRKITKKKLKHGSFRDIVLSNRTEGSYDTDLEDGLISVALPTDSSIFSRENPLMPSSSIPPNEDSTEDPSEEILTMDREKMFILVELGLIIQRQHLTIGEFIGSGQFGKVFKGFLQIPDQEDIDVAIKTLYRHLWINPIKADLFMKEALTMKDFDHPHVLGLLGVCFEGNIPHIVLPFMENGDLCNYIRDKTKVLLVSDLLKFAVDVASGMCYLANQKFVHRDLAARNCVLDSSMRAKVADFGLSRDIYEANYYRSQDKKAELPFRWTAPEVIETHKSTIESDVWSYGVLLWELMTRGSTPYAGIGNWDVLPYIKSGNRLYQPQFCPKPLYLSMLACWNSNPKNRPTFFQLHPFIYEIKSRLESTSSVEDTVPSSVTVSVPAQNAIYYNSKELYAKMDGHVLNVESIEETSAIEKELEEAYVVMENDENIVEAQSKK